MRFTLADNNAKQLSKKEIADLLSRPNLLRVGFLDKKGRPIVHPVWYLYLKGRFFFATDTNGRKADLFAKNPNVYFLVDENSTTSSSSSVHNGSSNNNNNKNKAKKKPPIGVRGRGTARVFNNPKFASQITKCSVIKYMGTTKSRQAKAILRMGPNSCVIEIDPHYMATWKF
jgi:hypothetical protein